MTSNDAHQERDVNQKNIDKVNALHAELSVLRDQINDSSQTASIERGEEFLLSEFQQVNDLWRHTDSRLESGLNIYLTATAIVIPGLVYIFQNINDFSAFLKIYSLIAIGLLVGGLVLDRRISGTARVKAEYIHALNRIRGYFKERYPQIAQRLVLPSEVDTDGLAIQRIKHHKAVFNLSVVVQIWNSFLVATIFGAITLAFILDWKSFCFGLILCPATFIFVLSPLILFMYKTSHRIKSDSDE